MKKKKFQLASFTQVWQGVKVSPKGQASEICFQFEHRKIQGLTHLSLNFCFWNKFETFVIESSNFKQKHSFELQKDRF